MFKPRPVAITPDILLRAYACGMFPMAEDADDPGLHWVEPQMRGVFPLDGLRVSTKLARIVRSDRFRIRVDADFAGVIDACAAPAPGRRRTWINQRIRELYRALHDAGHCHSVEAYDADGALAGGLYGVRLGAAFFGESMFHRASDASKTALVHLVARLRRGGFMLLDTQFVTPHLASLGAVELPRKSYRALLEQATQARADFFVWPRDYDVSGAEALAALTTPAA